MTASGVLDDIARLGIVPVVVVDDPSAAAPLGAALTRGGLPCVEVTLRSPRALEAVVALAADPGLLVGAGTVVHPRQVGQAREAGAQFLVSPGLSPSVVAECERVGVPVIPGVATATEIMTALDLGLSVLKLFPAEAIGGVPLLRALSAPFGSVRFMPTGGISVNTLGSYIRVPSVMAVGGSWIAPPTTLQQTEFDQISASCAEAVAVVEAVRSEVSQ